MTKHSIIILRNLIELKVYFMGQISAYLFSHYKQTLPEIYLMYFKPYPIEETETSYKSFLKLIITDTK